jgi:hypothetical protein
MNTALMSYECARMKSPDSVLIKLIMTAHDSRDYLLILDRQVRKSFAIGKQVGGLFNVKRAMKLMDKIYGSAK